MGNCVKVLSTSEFKSNATLGDIFIMKDGRVVVFLGYNDSGWFHFLLVDSVIGKENSWVNSNTLVNVEWYNTPVVLRRFEESLNHIACNVPVKELILSYNKLPALINRIGHSNNSLIAGISNQLGLHQDKVVKKSKAVELKRGYVYKVQNKSYSELYLYLGYYTNLKVNSMYNISKDMRKAHLWMFCGDAESTTAEDLRYRLSFGYDGHFRLNIPKNKLTLVGKGKLNISDLPDENKFLVI